MKIEHTTDHSILARLNEGVQNLHHRLYPQDFKPFDLQQSRKAFEKILADPGVFAFLVVKNGKATGYILCMIKTRRESEFQYAKTSLLVDQVLVLDAYRKQGVASALLEKVIALAHDKGISDIELKHWEDNTAAAEFFLKKGFSYFNRKMKRTI